MIAPTLPNRRFMQFCWVVPDLESAVHHWVKTTGVGPFLIAHKPQHDDAVYRGQPTTSPPIDVAMSQAGDAQIELVCPLDDSPSVFRELFPRGKGGFHHVAIYTQDYDGDVAYYAAAGAPVAYSGMMFGNRVCWVDTVPALGYMVEILQAAPMIDEIFAHIRSTAENWDGRDPIRAL